ncbi:peptidoglycan DD-metalloendopeptidase family protein [Nitrincola sp. A-D6]|uniref:peptidoglycan DD-metalloendopeptidase family protein n=1 Tax=Nitrincola sp. A-D6 TaxID=1545442 RepID=UPI0006906EC8|nr:peptidoglycan DD-metalloendopeptidase family protein [Nitrincola sp. A-D6]
MQLRNTHKSALSLQSIPVKHLVALFLALLIILAAALWPGSDSEQATSERHTFAVNSQISSQDNRTITPQIRYRSSTATQPVNPDNSGTETTRSPDSVELTRSEPEILHENDEQMLSVQALSETTEIDGTHEDVDLAAPVELELKIAIDQGDTLSTIFDQVEISQTTMYQILSADEQVLALDILRPGNILTFRKHPETLELEEMELYIHAGSRIIYRRVDEQNFEYEEVILPGAWEQEILAGEIYGSFYVSAIRAGLSKAEIHQVNELLGEQIDFNRQIQAGDRFQIVRNSQYVDDESTGQTSIEGIRLQQRSRSYTAFLFDDGNYYDSEGESLTRAFRRHPHNQNFRVSSNYNPRRLHPVTGRVSPHNGTDFAMPTGTPVVSIGDGVVTRVENHPFAGRYLEIQHGTTYKTRYLHMHRIDVRRGETIQRGQRIGLSGATGRVTGPHLHFELHINGRPVNPMTASLPMATSVPKEQLAEFNKRVDELVAIMEVAREEQFAMRRDESQPGT